MRAASHEAGPSLLQSSRSSSHVHRISESTLVAELVFGSRLNILLIFFPLAVAFHFCEIDTGAFVFSLICLMPLAERLGFVTEILASHTNDALGGLLNATFGNATELIICVASLSKADKSPTSTYLRIVQLSLLGSILGNLLFVLGTAFVIGGYIRKKQSFNKEGMGVNSAMLMVSVVGIVLPSTIIDEGDPGSENDTRALRLSRFESAILLALYCLYLMFQLVTHKHLYEAESAPNQEPGTSNLLSHSLSTVEPNDGDETPKMLPHEETSYFGRPQTNKPMSSDIIGSDHKKLHKIKTLIRHQEPEDEMSVFWALFWLTVVTVLIAVLSEMVVSTIEKAHDELSIPLPFLSTIILPIVGNAAEHASAILFAYKDRMEITLGVAVGSSTQIAVFVIPATVVVAWIMDRPLSLDFERFEAFALFACVLTVIITMIDGTSNWIKGMLFMVTYTIVAGAFWVHSDPHLAEG